MKRNIKRVIFMILIIIWMVLIFLLSSQDATQSAELSGGLIDKILNLFDRELLEFEVSMIDVMQFIIRKFAHMFLYVVLAILVSIELSTYSIKKELIISGSICVCYAISDEIHQHFVSGRSGEIRDVLIDAVGVIIGICIVKFSRMMADKYKEKTIDKCI